MLTEPEGCAHTISFFLSLFTCEFLKVRMRHKYATNHQAGLRDRSVLSVNNWMGRGAPEASSRGAGMLIPAKAKLIVGVLVTLGANAMYEQA